MRCGGLLHPAHGLHDGLVKADPQVGHHQHGQQRDADELEEPHLQPVLAEVEQRR